MPEPKRKPKFKPEPEPKRKPKPKIMLEAEPERKSKHKHKSTSGQLPTSDQLEEELQRTKKKRRSGRVVRGLLFALITVAAIAVLASTMFMPVLQIYGTSMTPTLSQGEIVAAVKSDFKQGDIIAFYYNNKILVKRVIAFEGDVIDIDKDGNVSVNNELLDEPYLTEKAFGECDISLPYQVPAEKIFVLGDHRDTSVDSRSSMMGCVSDEMVVGKILFRVWPLSKLGGIK